MLHTQLNIKFKKFRLSRFVLFFIISLASVSESLRAETADRLILEINHIAYTQRQIELYMLCVNALKGNGAFQVAGPNNWSQLVDNFKTDMVVDQEALRIGSFDPTRKMIDKAMDILNAKTASSPELTKEFARLQADKISLSKSAAQGIRIENFRRSKQKQAAIVSDKTDPNTINITTRFANWQKDLEDRAVLRYFTDAKVFRPLKDGA